jgi:beta-carotene 3-hydroxylase
MNVLLFILLCLAAILSMEFVAWFAHKYLMHGPLWHWHADHHKKDHASGSFWEKNDRFFLVFATPGILCLFAGSFTAYTWLLPIGIGITIYGFIYFLIHDVYIHRRFKWFRHLDNPYSRAVLRAHGAHHAKTTREDCESFGLLWINPKYKKPHRR